MGNADEVKAGHIAELGPELGPVFHALWQEHAWLRAQWQEFNHLFATSPERVELLNKVAPYFFKIVQDELWRSVLLRLRRLTDPSKSMGKENLTIQRLPALCQEPLRSKVGNLVAEACKAAAFARDWSNKVLAHADLDVHLSTPAANLPPATKNDTESAIRAIHSVLNRISLDLMDSEMSDEVLGPPAGSEAMLFVLADGIRLRDYRRVNRGRNPLPEELQQRPRL